MSCTKKKCSVPIDVYEDGELINGQHRLGAIKVSGKSIRMQSINKSFARILIQLTEVVREFLNSMETLSAYKESVEFGVGIPETPGKKMIFEGKLLRIAEPDCKGKPKARRAVALAAEGNLL